MQQFVLDVYMPRSSHRKSGSALLLIRGENNNRNDRVAEFPTTETGMFALSKLLEGLQYDVTERPVVVRGFFEPAFNDFDSNIEAERIVREFNILQTADRLCLQPEGC